MLNIKHEIECIVGDLVECRGKSQKELNIAVDDTINNLIKIIEKINGNINPVKIEKGINHIIVKPAN